MSVEGIINRVSELTGIFYPITSGIKTLVDGHNQLITMKQEYDENLKRKILDNSSLDDIEKAILISNITKSTVEFVNKARILGVAVENMDSQSQVKSVNEDWVLYFFDQAKNISSEEIQYIWGKIFALYLGGEISSNKKIINILSLLGQDDIDCFCTLCAMSFDNLSKPGGQYPFIYIVEYPSYYNNYGIRRYNLKQLDNLGLIEYDKNENFVLPLAVPKLKYGKYVIELEHKDRVCNGNVRFTEIGQMLYRITEVDKLNDFIKNCKVVWDKKEIKYSITMLDEKI